MKEIDNLHDFETWINSGAVNACAIQELDIRCFTDKIAGLAFEGSIFLGCDMDKHTAGHITSTGGMVIMNQTDLPFKIHKSALYSTEELFAGFDINSKDGYKQTFDYNIYADFVKNGMENTPSIRISLARRLHDHSISDALQEAIEGRKVVAIMGGHSMERRDDYYLKVAKISRQLTQQGFLMVSGGGPGAMEATHLGAYFACRTEAELLLAIDSMKTRPPDAPVGKEYADKDWLHRAWRILKQYPIPQGKEKASMSIGIPTWFYGHEPPTPFATHIAKYFANSVREDGLLAIAKHGVIFAPGSAGTIQEIFQDATQNHYAPYNTHKHKKYVSPMILFGIKRWSEELPLWNFISKAAEGRIYSELLCLTESEDEIIERISSYNPDNYVFPKHQ
ncbi:MAG: LOG family protein [Bacteroidales bacterium]